jgi:hypothetical protein
MSLAKKIYFLFMLLSIAVFSHSESALAEQVIVINPDGSVTVTDPTGRTPEQILEKRPPAVPAQSRAPRPADGPAVLTPPVKPDVPVAEKTPVPGAKPVAKTIVPPPEGPVKPASPKNKAHKDDKPDPGIPTVKESIGRVDPKKELPERAPHPVGPDEAKRIALDVAPPALSVDVFPADYSGTKVWQVIFKTEDGERYVLVERATGEIIRD